MTWGSDAASSSRNFGCNRNCYNDATAPKGLAGRRNFASAASAACPAMGPNSTAVDTNRNTVPDRQDLQIATQLFIASPPPLESLLNGGSITETSDQSRMWNNRLRASRRPWGVPSRASSRNASSGGCNNLLTIRFTVCSTWSMSASPRCDNLLRSRSISF